MIEVTCPHCGEVYHADAVHIGRRIRCTKCGSVLPILGAGGTIVVSPETKSVRPFQSSSSAESATPSPRRTVVLGSIVALVVVIALGLVLLLWRPSPNTSTAALVGQEPLATEQKPQFEVDDVDPPPCNERAPRSSMANGSRIVPDVGPNGLGVLAVQNGTNEDAVLSLYNAAADETIREIYVQAGHTVRVKGIPVGIYQLIYTAGLDWDASEAIFRCDPDYAQFERDFAFTEERDQEGVQYKTITVTLHPVLGGNVRTKKISRQDFLKNHRRTASLPR